MLHAQLVLPALVLQMHRAAGHALTAASCCHYCHSCSFVPLRYVQWLHTTPTMILLMSMMSDLPSRLVTAAVGGDLVMVLAGLGASWTHGPLQVGASVHATQQLTHSLSRKRC
jgi:bacteriorhodopsin